jgi:hypothetical protein
MDDCDDDIAPDEVMWVYDNDICDFMEDVQKTLKEVGVNVKITLSRQFPPERYDFRFEKVEQ